MWRDENGVPAVGSCAGSLRMRSSTGSTSICAASSSTAHSSANVPTASPGARMNVLGSMSMRAASTSSRMAPAAYVQRVPRMNGSGKLLWWLMTVRPVWISASKRPSARAPIATRCSVSVRPPTMRYTPSRVSARRTGRPASFAAAAASTWWRHMVLQPKPPPTNGDVTCTCSSGRPNTCAIDHAAYVTACAASYTRRLSPSHATVTACGSIAL